MPRDPDETHPGGCFSAVRSRMRATICGPTEALVERRASRSAPVQIASGSGSMASAPLRLASKAG